MNSRNHTSLILLFFWAFFCFPIILFASSGHRPAIKNNNAPQIQSKFITVKVSGSGETLVLAQKNAKDNALTEVVGMALRSDNIVLENKDRVEIISKIHAASAGYIGAYKELSCSKTKDGIFKVTALVTIYNDKLLDGFITKQDNSIISATDNSDLLSSDEERRRDDMNQYIVSYMIDYCRIWQAVPVKMFPEYDNNDNAVLHVNFYWGTTVKAYNQYLSRLRKAMQRINVRETTWNYARHHKYF